MRIRVSFLSLNLSRSLVVDNKQIHFAGLIVVVFYGIDFFHVYLFPELQGRVRFSLLVQYLMDFCYRSFSVEWWFWLTMTGISIGCVTR